MNRYIDIYICIYIHVCIYIFIYSMYVHKNLKNLKTYIFIKLSILSILFQKEVDWMETTMKVILPKNSRSVSEKKCSEEH